METQYTLSLGVCPLCSGNPVLEWDGTWNTFTASLCECKEKSCEFSPHRERDYIRMTRGECSNCGIDLREDVTMKGNRQQFGNFCSKGCATSTASRWSI